MRYMNVNSTAQIQQFLFAPGFLASLSSSLVPAKKGREGLPREKIFQVENTTGYIEPGKKRPLKNRPIKIQGLGIPPISYTEKGLPQCNAATITELAGKCEDEDPANWVFGKAYEALGGENRGKTACLALTALSVIDDESEW